jgi:hypothetical protein
MGKYIQTTAKISLFIQFITQFIIIATYLYIYNKNTRTYNILRELLSAEIIVQTIEGIFYIWMVYNILQIKNITIFRYIDWVFTTPTMLITLILYLIFLRNKENIENLIIEKGMNEENDINLENDITINNDINRVNKEKFPDAKQEVKDYTYLGLFNDNFYMIFIILLLNWLMLMFGYMGEMKVLSVGLSTMLGFIPFVIMFYLIYYNYAMHTRNGSLLVLYFVITWGLYGVAALMNYSTKNIMYNILDLFSKNFFGLFLSYVIFATYTKSKK